RSSPAARRASSRRSPRGSFLQLLAAGLDLLADLLADDFLERLVPFHPAAGAKRVHALEELGDALQEEQRRADRDAPLERPDDRHPGAADRALVLEVGAPGEVARDPEDDRDAGKEKEQVAGGVDAR